MKKIKRILRRQLPDPDHAWKLYGMTIVIFMVIFLGVNHIAKGQPDNWRPFVTFKFDPSMAFDEVGYSWGDVRVLNWEVNAGVEWDYHKLRVHIDYEENHIMDYSKLTWGVDKMIKIGRFKLFGGAEVGRIAEGRNGDLSFGLNGELEFKLFRKWENFFLMINTNWHRAEASLVADGKGMRWETMIGGKYKFW